MKIKKGDGRSFDELKFLFSYEFRILLKIGILNHITSFCLLSTYGQSANKPCWIVPPNLATPGYLALMVPPN